MLAILLLASSTISLCGAVNLYVASQNIITSLSLTGTAGNFTLRQTYTNDGCAADPSWLTFDGENRILYCFDDDVTNNGSISSYTAGQDGRLTQINRLDTPNGPVSGILYGDAESRAVLVAN
jgi:6-phosphogluconolactonase (cycloisomerase 2 family)